MTKGKQISVLLHLSAGGALVLAAILVDYWTGEYFYFGLAQELSLGIGLVIISLGFFRNLGFISRVSTNICLSVLILFTLIAVSEWFFKAIDFDFNMEKKAWREVPPFFRKPRVATGEGFFRRAPETWIGQVLNTRAKQRNILPNPYTNEAVITVKYNRIGFRNPDDISEWDIVVAGDSFTELGFLPYEKLYTTILGKILNKRILNLSVSYATSFSELSYLQDYGISPRTKHAIIAFFEGNDLRDLGSEYEALIRWRESGQREKREFKKQSSLVKAFKHAFYNLIRGSYSRSKKPRNLVNAYFKSPHSDIPITLKYATPNRSSIPEETLQQLNYFFKEYSNFGTERQITVWLAFIPTKRRVHHGQVKFTNGVDENLESWRPSDLPEFISDLCDQYGIRFIDLTPALVKETLKNGHLVYNSIFDTHLNSIGSLVVAQELARHIAPQEPSLPNKELLAKR